MMSGMPALQVQEQGFRPSTLRLDVAIRTVSLVLCNDKLTTYGAPDVLQVSVDQLDGHFYRNACFADRPPNQVWPPVNKMSHSNPPLQQGHTNL